MTDTLFLRDKNTSSQAEGLPRLKLDPDKYRHHLENMDITEEQANELMATLWQIMSTMVDIGWGVDILNIVLPDIFNQQINAINERNEND
ncbi:hypothetical protein [Agarilytica rhodophyticola]|uniref:hypothetical protein n=1 Tax=Agarilytica rhodophyticola TaxID=1737490 RepID=UPI000B346006|nr:hypothetical protein [Agarilytica rhodophyticola]